MAIAFWKITVCNLFVGIICVGLTMYTYTFTPPEMFTEADTFAIVMTCLVVAESILAALFCTKIGDCCCYLCYKCIWCFGLTVSGTTLLLEAFTFWEQKYPSCLAYDGLAALRRRGCQFLEIKIALGVLFVLNGIIYLCSSPERPRPNVHGPSTVLLPPDGIVNNVRIGSHGPRPAALSGVRPSRTTVITTNNPRGTAIVNIHNTSVTQPLLSAQTNIPNRPQRSTATAQAPRYENQGPSARPLPPLPVEPDFGQQQLPYAPSAPPPMYSDPPPPYSTLPPSTQPPKNGGRF